MNINILGFNIFAKGGTSRSNINLIKSFLKQGYIVNYFNNSDFDQDAITRLFIHEDIDNENLKVYKFRDIKLLSKCDVLIITREDLFHYAKDVKAINNSIKVIGEIHGPMEYIDDSIDLCLEAIDGVRVSTEGIKQRFICKYNYKSVFNKYVNAEHIKIKKEPINTKRNLLIKARFEDGVKDISYVIKLVNYIIKNTKRDDIQLYIVGYGPSEALYKNLVNYYNLQDNIHINEKEPLNYIYISSSPYETLGYSILETLARGNRALIYPGNDNVLKEVYDKYHGIKFLEKNLSKDSKLLLSMLNNKYSKENRLTDVENLNAEFLDSEYSNQYLKQFKKASQNKRPLVPTKYRKRVRLQPKNKIEKLDSGRVLYKDLKEKPFLSKVLKNNIFFEGLKKYYNNRKERLSKKILNDIEPKESNVFIESFHGNNFSGDPKYIALSIQKTYPQKNIFVSSANSLVDIEIRNYGFKPIRFGTEEYKTKFRQCKYVFMNSNSWDKVYKHPDQVFVQTWHGFPLKKMVNDLEDEKERKDQLKQFRPRMKKWDYLLTSSKMNTMLLESAFNLKDNENLQILDYGAPRNEYLLSQVTDEERKKLQRKYLFTTDENKKYILFCPTWRKKEREDLTSVDLVKLLEYLPKEYEIIVKLHPNEGMLRSKYNSLDARIHCFYNEFVDIQELYILCETMITDYSSTIFDFAHLNKPILLLQEDVEMYQKDIGFYFNIFELGHFPIVSLDEEKLALQLKGMNYMDYSKIVNRLISKDSKESSQQILNTVFEETNSNGMDK
ncbi:CDP-glycerol glycerophosphotransferase family protein [Staphylococcus xylosus]|uniref:CDP-glycerol glycerophosphotransferase family protein n=1 Tax=Staphylococcus xylosus TaxID=1288 RepID=UPI00403EB119